ncbi:MAG: hbd1 [Oscillospiraceae bacterium]|nr:hbd1 [Oscillospiraceae bacterium]
MKKVYMIGAGVMGTDIAQLLLLNGYEVFIRDIAQEYLDKAKSRMEKSLGKLAEKGKLTQEQKNSALSRLTLTLELNDAADCDLVIEAIVESAAIKKDIFKTLDGLCKPETILASNTSSISITELAGAVKRQDRFIGMHFFNPATVMKLVEVIKGAKTSQETFDTIYKLSEEIGKEPVEVNDGPGFVVNKILVPMINEAICVLGDGIASAEAIDKAMKLGANHPMGPLALSDLIGNDVVLHIMDTLYQETGDPKYRAHLLLRKMVRAGELGKKAGKGFYTYTN